MITKNKTWLETNGHSLSELLFTSSKTLSYAEAAHRDSPRTGVARGAAPEGGDAPE